MIKQPISRRDFMWRTAGVTGTALATRTILLGSETLETVPQATVPPSDRVRFGIIGIGMQGTVC